MAHPNGTKFKGPVISTNGFKMSPTSQALTYIADGTVAVDPASISATSSAETSVTIAGVAAGDIVMFNVPASLETGLVFSGARVSAADTVQLRLTNVTAISVDGASRTWSYIVFRVV